MPFPDIIAHRNLLDTGFGNVAEIVRLAHYLALEGAQLVERPNGSSVYEIGEGNGNQLLALLYVLERYVETVEAQRDAIGGSAR